MKGTFPPEKYNIWVEGDELMLEFTYWLGTSSCSPSGSCLLRTPIRHEPTTEEGAARYSWYAHRCVAVVSTEWNAWTRPTSSTTAV